MDDNKIIDIQTTKDGKPRKKATRRERSMLSKLRDFVPRRLATFIIWYHTPEQDRLPFDEWSKKNINGVDYNTCMEWFVREDFQEAMKFYLKSTRTYRLMQVYYAMLEKANDGDVQAAKYIENFSLNEKFFDDTQDDLAQFLSQVKIKK